MPRADGGAGHAASTRKGAQRLSVSSPLRSASRSCTLSAATTPTAIWHFEKKCGLRESSPFATRRCSSKRRGARDRTALPVGGPLLGLSPPLARHPEFRMPHAARSSPRGAAANRPALDHRLRRKLTTEGSHARSLRFPATNTNKPSSTRTTEGLRNPRLSRIPLTTVGTIESRWSICWPAPLLGP